MGRIRVEFTVEPFTEGEMGRHVGAAHEVLRDADYELDVGPFGAVVTGDGRRLLATMGQAVIAAFDAGASRVAMSASALRPRPDDVAEFLTAMTPIARAIGSTIVDPEDLGPDDVPLTWQGEVVGGLHSPAAAGLRNGLGRLVGQVEKEFKGRLAELPRAEKQRAVRLLDERGAFAFRNAVDEVADAMGVSRVTVYNYLNATRSAPS